MSNDNMRYNGNLEPGRSSNTGSKDGSDKLSSPLQQTDREVPLVNGYDKVWLKINADSDTMRMRAAPAGMQDRIMAALPNNLYVATGSNKVVSWLKRQWNVLTQSRPSDLA